MGHYQRSLVLHLTRNFTHWVEFPQGFGEGLVEVRGEVVQGQGLGHAKGLRFQGWVDAGRVLVYAKTLGKLNPMCKIPCQM